VDASCLLPDTEGGDKVTFFHFCSKYYLSIMVGKARVHVQQDEVSTIVED
jgi:hypothetical protein